MEGLLVFIFTVILINSLIFFLVPDKSSFSFNLKDFTREPWRYLTFQFFHTNITHLIENTISFLLVGFLAKESEIKFKTFLIVYFLSIFIIPIPLLLFFPDTSVVGNSMGIFGVLGFTLMGSGKLIPKKITIPLSLFFIFSLSIFKFFSCGQCFENFLKTDVLHFCGFACGMLMTYLPGPRPKYVLRCEG